MTLQEALLVGAVLSLTPTLRVNFRFLKILGLGFHVDKGFYSRHYINTSMYILYIHTCVFLLKLLHMGKLTMPPRKTIPWCSFEVTVAFEPIDDQHFVCKACL